MTETNRQYYWRPATLNDIGRVGRCFSDGGGLVTPVFIVKELFDKKGISLLEVEDRSRTIFIGQPPADDQRHEIQNEDGTITLKGVDVVVSPGVTGFARIERVCLELNVLPSGKGDIVCTCIDYTRK